MSLPPPRQPDPASDRPEAAGRSRAVVPRAAASPEEVPDGRDRQASQRLVAAKQFDIYGLIG
ncbi:hypothetical protein VQ02_16650 [Methylobacterium variabile]|jgi:hypothetical protein|uniref:Uncharacterized protein n=1 Tax=Methylobacterium variabile TaxID=298794 RepID=A0A0J6SR65_9HYPH|nr:hypothetical protein [Methylobacterium variabile]KMO35868.1 hypothetical protein VQ02_16650 [Methylobacterium variabile]